VASRGSPCSLAQPTLSTSSSLPMRQGGRGWHLVARLVASHNTPFPPARANHGCMLLAPARPWPLTRSSILAAPAPPPEPGRRPALLTSSIALRPCPLAWHAVDQDEGGLRVFESGAVLQYLCDCKCPAGSAAAAVAAELLPPTSKPQRRGPVLAWLSWMTVRGQLLGWQRAAWTVRLGSGLARACAV